MKVERFETKRVKFYDGFYIDITPMEDDRVEGYYDFWLYRQGWGVAEYCGGYHFSSEDEMLDLAEACALESIPYLREQCV